MHKIAISINSSWNFINFRSGLIRALRAADYEVVALAPRDDYSMRLADLECRFLPLTMEPHGTSPLRDLQLLYSYRKILKRERPSAFLGYTIKPNIYGSLAAHSLGIPVINNIAGLGTTFLKEDLLNNVVRLLYRAALFRSRVVFFQNVEQRDLFVDEGLVPSVASHLLPGSGVDLDRFRPSDRVPERNASEQFTFVLISRLLWAKGIGEYAEAARRVKARHPLTRFQLVGRAEDGPSAVPRTVLDKWAQEGVVHYFGPADDVRPYIAEADCVVLPSYYPEGTPRSLLEAAAMGKPLLTTDTPGCRNVVEDRANGYLCIPRNAASLAEGMEWLLARGGEELAAMALASRRKVEEEFDEHIVIERYLAAIEDTIRCSNRH
jgi:glycosyltransferase involved in cell wall biosynthesis